MDKPSLSGQLGIEGPLYQLPGSQVLDMPSRRRSVAHTVSSAGMGYLDYCESMSHDGHPSIVENPYILTNKVVIDQGDLGPHTKVVDRGTSSGGPDRYGPPVELDSLLLLEQPPYLEQDEFIIVRQVRLAAG